MRLDRFISLQLVRPVRRIRPGKDRTSLPILMYHSISNDSEERVHPYYRTCTSVSVFDRHMKMLHAEGYHAVCLDSGLDSFYHAKNDSDRLVVLTFDDGFRDFHHAAFPVLNKYGFGATVFLPTAFVGDEPCKFKERECLTWSEVRELHKLGVEFGSHTVSHPKLYQLGMEQIRAELEQSKARMEDQLGEPVRSFAYPYAFPGADRLFVDTFRKVVAAAGYTCCATTEIGRVKSNDDPYRLKRLPANSSDDQALLRAKLRGDYDWLGGLQILRKMLRKRRNKAVQRKQLNSIVSVNDADCA